MSTPDIRKGDLLVVDGKEYPIEEVQIWPGPVSHASFAKMATVTAHTMRRPAVVGNKRGAAENYLSDFACIPPVPLSSTQQVQLPFQDPYQLSQAFVEGSDEFLMLIIREADR